MVGEKQYCILSQVSMTYHRSESSFLPCIQRARALARERERMRVFHFSIIFNKLRCIIRFDALFTFCVMIFVRKNIFTRYILRGQCTK